MSSAAYKKEKKLIEEKVQKIRQVISPSYSRNQIEMALHTHDLDVERTIQAFLEDGIEGALGDWENTAKSKSKKKNTSAKANSTASSTVDSTTTTTGNSKEHNGKSTTSSYNGYEVTSKPLVPAASSSNAKTKQTSKTASSNTNGIEKTKLNEMNGANKGGKAENAEESITRCFKEIRQILAEREKQLLFAMRESNMTARFTYDRKLVNSLANFGDIVCNNGTTALPNPLINAVPSHSNEIKHATSHSRQSSLVSSVGEDSGFGQISPVAQEKNVARVESSGITMQSNAISADQLAEIQRQLAEQLKAQGIDPSVLMNASSNAAPPRRRQEKQNGNNKKQQNGGNKKKSPIELSILN